VPDQPHELPAELRAFLHHCIGEIEQLEILVASRGSQDAWSAQQMAIRLSLSEEAVNRHVEALVQRGLFDVKLANDLLYRYDPVSEELRRGADLLAEYYRTSRTAVMRFIATRERRSMRDFSDAFRLRNRK
jgi:predicted ArsR family transcriptional regulator